jgi:hypothetical protein
VCWAFGTAHIPAPALFALMARRALAVRATDPFTYPSANPNPNPYPSPPLYPTTTPYPSPSPQP